MSVPEKLPKGVTHVSGKVYRVDISAINFADGGFDRDSKDLAFVNLRHALLDQKLVGRGLSKEDMSDLRERIRTEGLLHTPMLRWHDNGVQIVMGERRIRCLIKLVHENADCFDRESGQYVKAKDLYGTIACEIHDLDDRQAYKLSFSETESVKLFGDGSRIAAISYFRVCGEDDKSIISITGLGPEWLRQTDKLTSLGKECFAALCNEEMNLQVAQKLLELYPTSEEDRNAAWAEWKKNSEVRFAQKQEKAAAAVQKATEKESEAEDLAEAIAEDKARQQAAQKSTESLDKKAAEVEKKKAKAGKQKAAAEAKVNNLAAKKPKATPKDTAAEVKPLTYAKVEKLWTPTLTSLIKSDGCDADGKKIESIDMQDVKLVKLVVDQMRKGQTSVLKILSHHFRKKSE